ncbi:MAG: lysoplasmalogenase [Chloroflexi bacterium]|nr:MAG: lysoplasmalogenase [Chloroflexota bacterium]
MTGLAWLALAVTAVLALAEWFAVAASRRGLEYVAKPAVMVGLIAFAILLHPADSIERTFFVVALTFGLISDIFLMLPRDMFLLGLVAALVEHLAYIAGFNHRPLQAALLAVAAVIALVSVAVILPPVIRALRKNQPALVWPVVAYVTVFVIMVSSSGSTGSLVALAGALLFFYSDGLLAWNRFVKPLSWGRLGNIVLYHTGQALIVLSLLS